eukprot:140655_1
MLGRMSIFNRILLSLLTFGAMGYFEKEKENLIFSGGDSHDDPVGLGDAASYGKYIDNIMRIIQAIQHLDTSDAPITKQEFNAFLTEKYGINSGELEGQLYDIIDAWATLQGKDEEMMKMLKGILNHFDFEQEKENEEKKEIEHGQSRRLMDQYPDISLCYKPDAPMYCRMFCRWITIGGCSTLPPACPDCIIRNV